MFVMGDGSGTGFLRFILVTAGRDSTVCNHDTQGSKTLLYCNMGDEQKVIHEESNVCYGSGTCFHDQSFLQSIGFAMVLIL